MPKTIAIFGAGRRVSAAVAETFGSESFAAALVSTSAPAPVSLPSIVPPV